MKRPPKTRHIDVRFTEEEYNQVIKLGACGNEHEALDIVYNLEHEGIESYNEAKQHVDAELHIDLEFGTLIDLLIEDAYSEKPRNPVIDILQKLNVAIDGKPARLLEVVDEEVAKYYSDPDNYQFANPEYINDIDNAIKLINIIIPPNITPYIPKIVPSIKNNIL
mgnify:CR=1 FL=1